MSRSMLVAISLGIAASTWIVGWMLSFHDRGYERGREEGYEKGFADGETRTHLWWIEQDREVEQARQKIRQEQWNDERWP